MSTISTRFNPDMLVGNSFGENKTGASFIRGNEYFSKQNDEIKEKAVKGADKTPK